MYRNKADLLANLVSQGVTNGGYHILAAPDGSSQPNFMDTSMEQWDGLSLGIGRIVNGVGDGIVDDTIDIQSALDSTSNTIVLPAGTYLTSGNDIPSDKTLIFMAGAKLKLKDGSNRPALQNKNWQSNTDKNITIIDAVIDGNDANQAHHLDTGIYAGEYLSGIRFFGVTNLTLIRPVINHAKTFAIWCASISNLVVDSPIFNQTMTGTPANQDGLHLNGPITGGSITNVTGSTNDDMIALNADDGALGNTVTKGAIKNVIIDGVNGTGCLNGIRLLSATSRIDQIQIKNVIGSYRDPAINLSSYGLGSGNFGSITIDGVDCNCSNPYAGADYYGVIVLNNNIENISISNVHRNRATDNRPTILVLPAANMGNLEINGLNTFSTTGAPTYECNIHVQGLINRLILSNVNWFRDSLLPLQGAILWVDGNLSASPLPTGIHEVIINNGIVNSLADVISCTGGLLDTITISNFHDIGSNGANSLLNLSSNGTTTNCYIANAHTDTGRQLVKASNGAIIGSKSTIGSTGTSASIEGSCVTLSATQTIPSSVFQKLSFNTEVYDNNSQFDISNNSFTASKSAGLFLLDATIAMVYSNTTQVVLGVYKNGTAYQYLYNSNIQSTGGLNITVSTMISLALGDVIDLRLFMTNGGTVTAGFANTALTIERIK